MTVRVGDLLEVAPAGRPGGWRVADYPSSILRLQGTASAAGSHTFLAVATGEGRVALAAATETFVVRVRVLRDTVVPAPP